MAPRGPGDPYGPHSSYGPYGDDPFGASDPGQGSDRAYDHTPPDEPSYGGWTPGDGADDGWQQPDSYPEPSSGYDTYAAQAGPDAAETALVPPIDPDRTAVVNPAAGDDAWWESGSSTPTGPTATDDDPPGAPPPPPAGRRFTQRPPGRRFPGGAVIGAASVVALLLVGLGIGGATGHADTSGGVGAPQVIPVSSTQQVCPATPAGTQSSSVSAYTPVAGDGAAAQAQQPAPAAGASSAPTSITPLDTGAPPLGAVPTPGTPATYTVQTPLGATDATVHGSTAPGYTMQQTLVDNSGPGRGLASVMCGEPGAEFWFAGAATDSSRLDHLMLANPENTNATVNFDLYGPTGILDTPTSHGVTLAPGQQVDLLLSAFATTGASPIAAVHVWAGTGRVSAALLDTSPSSNVQGADWIPATAAPAKDMVIPGIPADATNVELVMVAPDGDADVSLKVSVGSTYVPAGHESVHLAQGKAASIDISDAVRAAPLGLVLHSDDGVFVAGVRLSRTVPSGDKGDRAFLSATPALTGRAVIPDNQAGSGKLAQLMLTAGSTPAKVDVTTVGGAAPGGARPATAAQQVNVPAGATVAVNLTVPAGATSYAVVVADEPGSGPVYGARMMTLTSSDSKLFTIQPLLTARETVVLPRTVSDVGVGSR